MEQVLAIIQENTLQMWLIALALAVISYFILSMTRRFVDNRLTKLNDVDKAQPINILFQKLVHAVKPLYLVALALFFGTRILTFTDQHAALFKLIAYFATMLQIGVLCNTAINYYVSHPEGLQLSKKALPQSSLNVIGIVAKVVVWIFIILLILDNLGQDIAALITGLGVVGIAVAFAVQSILKDIFASFSIILDKPFHVGDFIIVNEFMGTIERIGLKTTRIRSLGGEQLIFSNADLLNSRIRNYKRMSKRRVVFSLGVIYQTTHDKLSTIPQMIKEIIDSIDDVQFDRAHFKEFGSSSLNFEAVYYVMSRDYNIYMDKHEQVNLQVYKKFHEAGIEFAYPTTTVYLEQLSS